MGLFNWIKFKKQDTTNKESTEKETISKDGDTTEDINDYYKIDLLYIKLDTEVKILAEYIWHEREIDIREI